MVRGAAALLVAVAWFLAVGELGAVSGEAGRYVAGCAGALSCALAALALLPGRDEPLGVAVLGAGAAFLAAVLAAQDVGAAANPVEALAGAAAGLLFAWAFASPVAVVALPLVVAGVDLASVLTGPAEPLRGSGAADVLTLDLPLLGGGGSAARLGVLDMTFLALFAAWSVRYRLRPRVAIPLMALALCGSVALGIALDRAMPALPFLAAGLLLPAAGRLRGLLARPAER
ncbi:MAG TPA: hypothetical protein VGW75_07445 [Solirubrobacteraceae bacterium]|nr:hypothetical protein [Solirubrobacteraceae bacterium]